MSTKLIITEKQLINLKASLNESNYHEMLVDRIVGDLNKNYEPMVGVVRADGEYHEKPMVKIIVDDSEIEVKDLFKYFKKKYKLGDDFIRQVIKDWMFGTLVGNKLSKNVSIS